MNISLFSLTAEENNNDIRVDIKENFGIKIG